MSATVAFVWLVAGLAAVAATSPLLAAWSVALADGRSARWWRPRVVGWVRVALVAVVALVLAAAGLPARPSIAWLVLAAGGAVLCVVDVQTHRLPLPLILGLVGVELVVLSGTAAVTGEPGRLGRAVVAAAAVTAAWFLLALAAPKSLGLGDVWLAGLCGGLLGWSSWSTVLAGQVAAWLLAVPLALAIVVARPAARGRRMQVPLGPAIVAGAIVAAAWL